MTGQAMRFTFTRAMFVHRASTIAGTALLFGVFAVPPQRLVAQTPADTLRAVHLLNRATFGVRPADISNVLSLGNAKWLDQQLHPERIRDTLIASIERRYPATTMSMRDMYSAYARPPRPRTPADSMMMMADAQPKPNAAKQNGRSPQNLLGDLASAKLERAALSDRQLEEVMTDFWFNHFNVFFQKGADRYLVADYERNAIRPHVFGKFEDLLVATAQHPAMLFYLDNWQSVHVDTASPIVGRLQQLQRMQRARQQQMRNRGQQPPAQQKAQQRQRGLNENYARELLELHTLGVDGGYSQTDVVNVARALTGWTFVQPRPAAALGARGRNAQRDDDVEFVFRDQLHDHGDKLVLGHKLRGGRGLDDGMDVMHIVATHPSTAHFIAQKMVEYFVSDKPDPVLVDRVAAVFRKTDGDLREVTRALFSDPLFYAPSNVRAKIKTPFQLVASTLRVTNADMTNPRGAIQVLRTMGQLPYMASPPTGYPAMSEDWVNSGALLARMNFGIDFMSGKVPGLRPDARSLFGPGGAAGTSEAPLRVALKTLLPGVPAAQLEKTIAADVASQTDAQNPRAKVARAIGLVLGSPEFQKR